MREKLNENPVAQIALIGGLLVVAAIFAMSTLGGGSSGGGDTTTQTTSVDTPAGKVTATVTAPSGVALQSDGSTSTLATSSSDTPSTAATAPPPPQPVVSAWQNGKTVVLLIVREGGIDDRMVAAAVRRLAPYREVAAFIVPASKISRYAAITEGVDVNRVPALIVVRPKRLHQQIVTASVSYGFQSTQSVVQAVIDAAYKGRTVTYHP